MSTSLGVPSQPSSANTSQARDSEHAFPTACPDDGLSAFLSVRPRLFSIAYRMLGSAAEAEDVVQDVWVRWQTTDRSVVRDAAAFLATTATRLAINVMQSARSRRETHVGPWLPEPVDTSADPGLGAERGEALESGVRILLEKLSPTERAAYILREAFDYAYRDIANVLRLEEANARQVVTRARQHVANGRRMRPRVQRRRPSSRGARHNASPIRSMALERATADPEQSASRVWRNGDEENSSIDSVAVACGRYARGCRTPQSDRSCPRISQGFRARRSR